MSGAWTTMTLKAAGVALIDCVHKTPAAAADGFPYVAIPEMKGGRIDFEAARKISRADFLEWTKKARPQRNDVILSRRTNPGVIAVDDTGTDFALGQNLVLLRADGKRVFPPFLRWLAQGPEWWGQINKFINVGAVFSSLRCGDVPKFELLIPPLPEQQAIAAVLGALDDKIELNRRMNRTLEAMARALFRSWFVDFDPVHAKAEGRAPAHMDPAAAALFPARFGEDGLPEGWVREPIGRHVTVHKGLSYKGEGLCEEGDGVPLHNLNSIYEGGGYKDEGIKFYRGEHKPRHEVRPGDLIVANTEQGFDELLIGHSALVPEWLGPSGIFSHHIYKVEPKAGSPLSREWWYLALSCSWIGVRIRSFSNGTTVNMLPSDAFELPVIPVPPEPVVQAMGEIVRPMLRKQDESRIERRTLATLRDTLLPKLMSGELRVCDAERVLAEAV